MPTREELIGAAIDEAMNARLPLRSDDAELRLKCLAEAGAAAKLGLSADIYQTADKYYRWVMGEKIEAPVALPFKATLISMIEDELRSERMDIDLIREVMSEAFGIVEDRHWPQTPQGAPKPLVIGDREEAEAQQRAIDPEVRRPLEIDPESFLGARGAGADAGILAGPDMSGAELRARAFHAATFHKAGRATDPLPAAEEPPRMVHQDEIEADRRLRETEDKIVQPIVDSLQGADRTPMLIDELERILSSEPERQVRIRPDGTVEELPPAIPRAVHGDIRS